MAQRGFLFKLGLILKRWEQNKRQVSKNRDALLPGNKMEVEDFDIFDQWFARQRKFIREYLGTEEHEELRIFRKFFKQETDVPQIHIHFGIWSSLSNSDNKVTLERLTRLINEYHQSRIKDLTCEEDCPISRYQEMLTREHDIIKQIVRARDSYYENILVLKKFKARQDPVYLNMEGDYYNQRKVIHQAKISKKTYEDILRYEVGRTRAGLMKVTHELGKLVKLEEEKRLTQLLAIIEEYFRLLLQSSDMDNSRKGSLRHYSKQLNGLKPEISKMAKIWIKGHREAVEFPEHEDANDSTIKTSNSFTDLLRIIKDELYALQTRSCVDVQKGGIICLSASNDSIDDDFHRPEDTPGEVLFKVSSDCTPNKSTQASDLSVEDLEEIDSTVVFYPTVTSSARAFSLANQRSRHSLKHNQRKRLSASNVPHCEAMPGTIVSENDVAETRVRSYTRQITLSSGSEEELCESREQLTRASTSTNDEVVPLCPSANDTSDLRLSKLSGIYVMAKTSHLSTNPRELSFNAGDIIKQERACANGMAYGYRRSRFGSKTSGYYSVNDVKFYRLGTNIQNK